MLQEKLIQLARKSVPSFRWAIGAAGLLALAAIVAAWKINLATLLLIAAVLIMLAVAFVALNWIAKLKPGQSSTLAAFFAWSMLLMFVLAIGCVLSSAVVNQPWPIRDWISGQLQPGATAHQTAAPTTVTDDTPAQRIETLDVRWSVGPVPDPALDALLTGEIDADDYWYSDDNLKFLSNDPRQAIMASQNRALGRTLLQQLANEPEASPRGTILAILELNSARSLTLPFGALHIDEPVYPPEGDMLARTDLIQASSGVELLYPDARAPYDDDPERETALAVIRQRPRKRAPEFSYGRTGRHAELHLAANAPALADWIDKLPTTPEFTTPLPQEFRIVLLANVRALRFHPGRMVDIMNTLQRQLAGAHDLSADTTATARPLRTSWLSLKPNDRNETAYRVEWQRDLDLATRGGPEEQPEPVCRVSLFRAVRVSPAEFAAATTVPEPASPIAPEGVIVFASDPLVAPHSEQIKNLIGTRPLVELPLNTDLDTALAWCRKAQPAVVILGPDAFGPGRTLPFRAFLRAAVEGEIRAKVLRIFAVEEAEEVPREFAVSGFEEDAFSQLASANFAGKNSTERWSLLRSYLSRAL
jgi:hypothetical protein